MAEVGEKVFEVKEKTGVSDDENAEVTMKETASDDVNRISDDEKQRSEDEKGDFDILMDAYRNDFRENARKVLSTFAEDPEIDIPPSLRGWAFPLSVSGAPYVP